MGRVVFGCVAAVALLAAASPEYLSFKKKFDLIRADRAPAGSKVALTAAELNAFVRAEAPNVAKEGIREPRLELGHGRATGRAYVDFPKLRRSQGKPMGWFLSKLLAGERPVRVDARIVSSAGRASVEVDRVEVSGIPLTGGALDYVIRNYLWSYYPDAQIGKPFDLAHGIDRLEVQPTAVNVVIANAATRWRKTPQASGAAR
jgi:hypothetical protein